MEVIAKKNIKQTDRQIYHAQIQKILEWDHYEAENLSFPKKNHQYWTILQKNIGKQKLKNI